MRYPVWDENYDKLHMICKAFYQAYRLTGTVKMKFGLRTIPDSDGNSVVDVYLSPRDQEAANTLVGNEDDARHMQFLESMVPASVLGYQFILRIEAHGPEEVHVEVLDTIGPSTMEPPTGPGLTRG